jgi:hypothetical protein
MKNTWFQAQPTKFISCCSDLKLIGMLLLLLLLIITKLLLLIITELLLLTLNYC